MHLEFLVEELSAEIALRNLLPKLVTDEHSFKIITFQGKKDLLNKLTIELKAYKRRIDKNFRIIILVDRDDQDCRILKQELELCSKEAKLVTRTASQDKLNYTVVNRIASEELEAWFFGDVEAVKAAYPRVSVNFRYKARYRNPDQITGGTWEALERILKAAGYFLSLIHISEPTRPY